MCILINFLAILLQILMLKLNRNVSAKHSYKTKIIHYEKIF